MKTPITMYSSFYQAILGKSNRFFALILKITFGILIIYLAGSIFYMLFTDTEDYAVNVKPAREDSTQVLAQYNNNKVTYAGTGTFIITNPDLRVKLWWNPTNRNLSNMFESILIISIVLHSFLIFGNAASPEVSREKIGSYLRRIGYSFWFIQILNTFRSAMVKAHVLSYSNHEFRLDEDFTSPALIWLGVLFMAFGLAIKDIAGLKKEQELTI